jgi:hypothetical protein
MSANYHISNDSNIVGKLYASPQIDMGDGLMRQIWPFDQLKRLKIADDFIINQGRIRLFFSRQELLFLRRGPHFIRQSCRQPLLKQTHLKHFFSDSSPASSGVRYGEFHFPRFRVWNVNRRYRSTLNENYFSDGESWPELENDGFSGGIGGLSSFPRLPKKQTQSYVSGYDEQPFGPFDGCVRPWRMVVSAALMVIGTLVCVIGCIRYNSGWFVWLFAILLGIAFLIGFTGHYDCREDQHQGQGMYFHDRASVAQGKLKRLNGDSPS